MKEGWLFRQIKLVEKEFEALPEWMKILYYESQEKEQELESE